MEETAVTNSSQVWEPNSHSPTIIVYWLWVDVCVQVHPYCMQALKVTYSCTDCLLCGMLWQLVASDWAPKVLRAIDWMLHNWVL